MKKSLSGLLLFTLTSAALSGCALFQPVITTPITTGLPQTAITIPVTSSGTIPGTVPVTIPSSTSPATTSFTIAPATTSPVTKPPATKPPVTKPPATKPPATKPPVVSSNLPLTMKTALDQSDSGIILIYKPLQYPKIVAVTAWNVIVFDTNSQLLLVTKKKGSLVQLYDVRLTPDEQDTVINDVIRHWTTTADYEVIRIRHSDPETLVMNFIRVTEPSGKMTLTEIKSSMVGLPVWEVIKYIDID